MSTSAINGTSSSSNIRSTNNALNSMTSEDFYKLLITELEQQDPLEPADSSDMIGNVSQIRTIEQSGQLTQTLSALTQQQRTAGASDLLGKYVEGVGLNSAGEAALLSGVVSSIRFGTDGTAIVELDNGSLLSADNLTRITDQAPASTSGENKSTDDKTDDSATAKHGAPARVRNKAEAAQPWLDKWMSHTRNATSVRS